MRAWIWIGVISLAVGGCSPIGGDESEPSPAASETAGDAAGDADPETAAEAEETVPAIALTAISGSGGPGCTFELSDGTLVGEWQQSSVWSRGNLYLAKLELGLDGRRVSFDIDQEYGKRGTRAASAGYTLTIGRMAKSQEMEVVEDGVFVPSKARGNLTVERDGGRASVPVSETCFFD